MREVGHAPLSAPAETEYFGVLTSSPEESLDSARKSVDAPPKGLGLFAAVSGRHTRGRSRSALAHFEFPSEAPWSDPGLIEKAESVFGAASVWRETSWPKSADQPPPTFLFQLERQLKQKTKSSGMYVYNEQEYLLELGTRQQGSPPDRLLAISAPGIGLRSVYGLKTRRTPWSPSESSFNLARSSALPLKPCPAETRMG
jgi:hypothetical protein